MFKSKSTEKGFSLFEVLIAMSIMSSAAILMYMSWHGNQVRVQKMAINNKAAILLDQIMSELEIKYGARFEQLPESEGGVFEGSPLYSWEMESRDFEMPDLRSILISEDQGNEMILMVIDKLTEYLNESIKEMKVTVKYKRGKQSVSYSASTFMVDYNKSIPMGGAIPGGLGGGLGQ